MTRFFAVLVLMLNTCVLTAQDWPLFKGNIYFTGNNDEIIVKNANLKWLFQADDRSFNPVPSDGILYFLDMRGQLYALEEESGIPRWKTDVKQVSAQFAASNRSAGKVKYPLVHGPLLILTDPIAVYAFDKFSGKPVWARTGMRAEMPKQQGLSGYRPLPTVDGIYSDPIISDDRVYYGTRETFHARDMRNGGELWQSTSIKSYSAFPVFYDKYIFTQSMDHARNEFAVVALEKTSGKELWRTLLQPPIRIFPPVVYQSRVYVPSTTMLYCLELDTGRMLWQKDYGRYLTSNPSFTDRAILFTIDNKAIAVIDPADGSIIREIPVGEQSSPSFVTVRDQVYIAHNVFDENKRAFGAVKAISFLDGRELWSYRTPFPGGVGQPVASGGILFLPCGNYIYAIGALHYPRVVQGGSANRGADAPVKPVNDDKPGGDVPREKPAESIKERIIEAKVTDRDGRKIPATAEIRKFDEKGKLVYSKTEDASDGKITVPDEDNVEILFTSKDHLPKKKTIHRDDSAVVAELDALEKGKSIVVDNILFEFDSAYLTKPSLNILDSLARSMKTNPSLKIEVRGYTDNIGDASYNRRLSERRADAVADYLIKNGISPERVRGKGFGKENPIAPNTDDAGRAKNRRTEFFIIEK